MTELTLKKIDAVKQKAVTSSSAGALTLGLLTFAAAAPADDVGLTDTTLEKYIGVWDMELETHTETFGDRGGAGKGTMECRWGAMRAWVDCDMDADYEGLGRYALKVVLHRTGKDGIVGAFVTNSFDGGRLYVGEWKSDTELTFHDAWTDPRRQWEHQLTTYTFLGPDEIRYRIDVSSDNETFHLHSSGVYCRR